jgi:hypothetical protein
VKFSEIKEQEKEKVIIPQRQSKRKGAPKHIDQTNNNNTKKPTGGVKLIVKIHSPNRHDDDEDDEEQQQQQEMQTSVSLPTKRISPRRKSYHITEPEKTNPKKKFKRLIKDQNTSNSDSYDCNNLLKSSILTDIPIHNNPTPLNLTTVSNSLSLNSRPFNSVKGNNIERIAVSLLSVCHR